jgi:hypothetical protein
LSPLKSIRTHFEKTCKIHKVSKFILYSVDFLKTIYPVLLLVERFEWNWRWTEKGWSILTSLDEGCIFDECVYPKVLSKGISISHPYEMDGMCQERLFGGLRNLPAFSVSVINKTHGVFRLLTNVTVLICTSLSNVSIKYWNCQKLIHNYFVTPKVFR